MHFENPWFLLLLPLAAAVAVYSKKSRLHPAFRFSTGEPLMNLGSTLRIKLYNSIFLLRLTVLFLVVFALSRPEVPLSESKRESEGIDIVLAIDVSTTMLAEDFAISGRSKSRIDALRDVVREFIYVRRNDRIGIVIFASRAYTIAPLTLDYGWLLQNLERIKVGIIEDGTAMGSGLSSALNRLKDTKAKSKVVILLTDGRNNAGKVSPLTAAEAAGELDIKVYTIGVGSTGIARYPVKDIFGNNVYRPLDVKIDEGLLKQIAEKTHATYFRATDAASLRGIYREIEKLEKTHIEEKGYTEYKELFPLFLIPGLILLLLEAVLNNTILRRIP